MKRKWLLIGLVFLLVPFIFAAQKPDFSGKWVMDKNRSFNNPPGLEQTATVTHTGNEVKFDTKVKTERGGEQAVVESYLLDGKEVAFTPPRPPNAKGKRTAAWLPNGRGFTIQDETSVDDKVVSQITRKWTLSADGKTLTIEYFIDERVSYEAKRIFNKVE